MPITAYITENAVKYKLLYFRLLSLQVLEVSD